MPGFGGWETRGISAQGASEAIAGAERVGVCTISCWEVALLVARKRLAARRRVRALGEDVPWPTPGGCSGLDATTAMHAGGLDYGDAFPGDPADRIIYATAVEHGVRLVTETPAIAAFDPSRVIW